MQDEKWMQEVQLRKKELEMQPKGVIYWNNYHGRKHILAPQNKEKANKKSETNTSPPPP